MIVVTTPTGQIGTKLVRKLLADGEQLRLVVRDPDALDTEVRDRVDVVSGSHADPAVLDVALAGSNALFWLIPPDRTAPSAREHYLRFATAASAAIRRHRVGHVVGITSAGHRWSEPAGVLSAAFAMDAVLAGSGADYRALSLPFYMENLLGQLDSIRGEGVFTLACPADRPLATVATEDIADAAAGLLTDRSWHGQADAPLFGPDHLTPEQMAQVMSEELGRTIRYVPMTIGAFETRLRAAGLSGDRLTDTIEMFAAQAGGIYDADWAVAATGAIDFRTWCRTVLLSRAAALTASA